jgi:hypothetical protein
MIRSWLVSIGWLFVLAVSLPAWGDDELPKNLKSPDAKKAVQDYDKALTQAREAYEKETEGGPQEAPVRLGGGTGQSHEGQGAGRRGADPRLPQSVRRR